VWQASWSTASAESIGSDGRLERERVERITHGWYPLQDYLKRLFLLTTWTEVIDEIYNEVEHVEPWMGGNARGPSTAFCLMFKLCQLKLTTQQIRNTLDHADSPFIRAVRPRSSCPLPSELCICPVVDSCMCISLRPLLSSSFNHTALTFPLSALRPRAPSQRERGVAA
jgi:hypothetical protein